MKISIITVCLNARDTVEETIKSVALQSYPEIEYIIVDGRSTDGTVNVIKKHEDKISKFISEKDNGIYDAMNKGLKEASGEIIGFLNSDDLYAYEGVIGDVAAAVKENCSDCCYGDLVYVSRDDTNKIMRYWRSGNFHEERFRKGWMPPHPTFFARRSIYERYGIFDTNFPIAADYELMLRFLYKYGISTAYVPKTLVKMRACGNSHPGFFNTAKAIMENYKAWQVNDLAVDPFTFLLKPLSKIFQFDLFSKLYREG